MTYEPREYRPKIAIHPGETLLENLEFLGMSQLELATRTGLVPKTINEIIKCNAPISPETALKFEMALGIPASFWNNLQANYNEIIARQIKENQMPEELVMAEKFTCYAELAMHGLIEETSHPIEKARNLLKFFGIDSFEYLPTIQAVAFRRRRCKSCSDENLAAWLRWGEIEAQKIAINEFDSNLIKERLPQLRRLTKNPTGVSKTLQRLCAEAGVAVVFTPCLTGTSVNGATRWKFGKPIIQLSDRWKWSDVFWFTFFHELGHILKHGKKEEFLELQKGEKTEEEVEADDFAKKTLIPDPCYREIVENNDFSFSKIKIFAESIDIAPEIILGRLAKEGILPWKAIQGHRPQIIIKPPQTASQN